jgi:choline dehydrogenase-like flavoprotein
MIYIIGSGLSAMATAAALVARGIRPKILDVGILPGQAAIDIKARLGSSEPELWNAYELALAKRTGQPVAANGIPRKLYFGSDFSFQEPNQIPSLTAHCASLFRSFAAGGFSNIWGGVVQPVRDHEAGDWPISGKELAPHYAAITRLIGRSPATDLHSSSQAKALHADLSKHSALLNREGISFEYAQLAVRTSDCNGTRACRYCGLCLFGCPYDSRYTAACTLSELVRGGHAEYEPDVLVRKLTRMGSKIRIEGHSQSGEARTFFADRVFVAAGLLESTRIILESLNAYGQTLRIHHSDIFTVPLLRYRRTPHIQIERVHTLCQLTAEIDDPSICDHRVHLQFYGYNDLYRQLLAAKAGLLAKPLAPLLESMASRLFVIFGYLHSDLSSSIELTLTRECNPAIKLEGKVNRDSQTICRAIVRKLQKHHMCFKGFALRSQLKLDLPGGGYHSGGTLPMRRSPHEFQTDCWGQLEALPGAHVVDASILPTIPASPTAFTVMANAHRIASEVLIAQ